MAKRVQQMLFSSIGPYQFRGGEKIVAFGRTINDPRGFDGSTLRTSPIECVWIQKDRMYIETENTIYWVELTEEQYLK